MSVFKNTYQYCTIISAMYIFLYILFMDIIVAHMLKYIYIFYRNKYIYIYFLRKCIYTYFIYISFLRDYIDYIWSYFKTFFILASG